MTSNLAAISVTGVLAYPIKITIFENHYNVRGISRCLFPKCTAGKVAEEPYYFGRETDVSGKNGLKAIRKLGDYRAVEVLQNGLYYVPILSKNPDAFDYEFHCSVLPVLKRFRTGDELAFIDTGRENNISSKTILGESDIVVVTLRQDMQEIQNFFQNYSSLIPRAFFIIGNYDRRSSVTVKSILSEFNFRRDQLGVIPHLDEFAWAADSGRLIEFISARFESNNSDEERYFMQELKKTTFLLLQQTILNQEGRNWGATERRAEKL